MEPNIKEVAARIRALREDLDLTLQEMADATGRSTAEYAAQESGEEDLSFTFLYKCADKFGVDVIELLTGENPHLTGYSLTRAADGLSIKRRAGFEYLHKAPHFRHKLAEPFLVTAPYLPEEQDVPIHLSRHKGQELDFIISGRMRFAYEDHVEELEAGDFLMYDSGRGHGMIAIGGEPCVFLAVVLKPHDEKII
ncbi:helix-turn-helix domain-containing protein [Enterorhabdus sp. P55]|uniref:helix-turn-helix domain-containing protein n=1 Tax=Enterorhabdus sp. P55 TaxID=2304571 RepID=UPI001372072D|nr:cupin domain-containing protein [Enterorhabdus sp. P55]NBI31346.1 XRE family transcriptional regulator [Enterorhabdus sp. P55]